MSSLKHILITGTSTISWKDATIKAISDAGETLSNLTSVKILEQRANIQNNKISEYFVDMDLEFEIDKSIQNSSTTLSENSDE
jgi:flavin-binding protein dodecin